MKGYRGSHRKSSGISASVWERVWLNKAGIMGKLVHTQQSSWNFACSVILATLCRLYAVSLSYNTPHWTGVRIERRKTVGCGRNNGIDDAPTNAYPFSREINFLNGIYQISIICIYMVISVAFESFLQKIYRDIVRDRSYFFD